MLDGDPSGLFGVNQLVMASTHVPDHPTIPFQSANNLGAFHYTHHTHYEVDKPDTAPSWVFEIGVAPDSTQRAVEDLLSRYVRAIDDVASGMVKCRSNYMVVRTMGTGAMTIFAVGIYLDKILLERNGGRFSERIVVTDSRRIDTLLVIPL